MTIEPEDRQYSDYVMVWDSDSTMYIATKEGLLLDPSNGWMSDKEEYWRGEHDGFGTNYFMPSEMFR